MDSALLPKAASPHKITALQVPANGAALAYALLRHARAADTLQLVVTPDSFGAQQLEQDLRAFRPELPILHFPQMLGLALGIEPKDLGMNKHVVKTKDVQRKIAELAAA